MRPPSCAARLRTPSKSARLRRTRPRPRRCSSRPVMRSLPRSEVTNRRTHRHPRGGGASFSDRDAWPRCWNGGGGAEKNGNTTVKNTRYWRAPDRYASARLQVGSPAYPSRPCIHGDFTSMHQDGLDPRPKIDQRGRNIDPDFLPWYRCAVAGRSTRVCSGRMVQCHRGWGPSTRTAGKGRRRTGSRLQMLPTRRKAAGQPLRRGRK